MKVLGIYPGLQICGYACLKADDNAKETLIEAGAFRTDNNLPIELRLDQISEDTEIILERFQPDFVAVEQLYSHYKHPKTSILMGHARGVILQKCAQTQIQVKSFSATRIKKSITGNGRASKQQVQKSIQTILSLPQMPQPSDVADAIAAALCCLHSLSITAVEAKSGL